jgi:hypothetical protein
LARPPACPHLGLLIWKMEIRKNFHKFK